MTRREAKRLACRYTENLITKWLDSDWGSHDSDRLEDADCERLEVAMAELADEMRRRSGA